MNSNGSRPLSIVDIADRIGLSRGRISQLRKEVDFPAPTRRTLRRMEWDADEIAAWAAANNYPFRDDHAEKRIFRYWKEEDPGQFTLVETRAVNEASVLVYAEGDTRVAVHYGLTGLFSPQIKSITSKVKTDWLVVVQRQLALHSPFVRIIDTTSGDSVGMTLEDVARRLGTMLPYLDYDPAEASLILANRAGTTLEATPFPSSFFDLSAAYRVYVNTEDADIRALAAERIGAMQEGAADTFIQPLLERPGNPAGEVLRIGVQARRSPLPPSDGDATLGLEKILFSRPQDDDVIRLVTSVGGAGGKTIAHDSPVTAHLVRSTWASEMREGRTVPLTGHALLLFELPESACQFAELEFYTNASRELAIVSGDHVAMTRRRVEGRRPKEVVLVEREGAMYIDEDGVAYAPTYHQGIGYSSGNATLPQFIAAELGLEKPQHSTALAEALDADTIALNTPLPVDAVAALLRDPATR